MKRSRSEGRRFRKRRQDSHSPEGREGQPNVLSPSTSRYGSFAYVCEVDNGSDYLSSTAAASPVSLNRSIVDGHIFSASRGHSSQGEDRSRSNSPDHQKIRSNENQVSSSSSAFSGRQSEPPRIQSHQSESQSGILPSLDDQPQTPQREAQGEVQSQSEARQLSSSKPVSSPNLQVSSTNNQNKPVRSSINEELKERCNDHSRQGQGGKYQDGHRDSK